MTLQAYLRLYIVCALNILSLYFVETWKTMASPSLFPAANNSSGYRGTIISNIDWFYIWYGIIGANDFEWVKGKYINMVGDSYKYFVGVVEYLDGFDGGWEFGCS